jgi:hypothetical protein
LCGEFDGNEAQEQWRLLMEAIFNAPGLFLGIIGWAACAMLIIDSQAIGSMLVRGALIVFLWMLWMIPAFDIIVYQGLMPANVAITYGVLLTVTLISAVSLIMLMRQTNNRNKR